MNFTVDDSSTELNYSNGWAVQSPSDPDVDRFFQSTYHVAETVSASVNLAYSATAVYIYGSKGPGHGNFRVQFDNDVYDGSAWSNETMYQQLLFQRTFDTVNENHSLSFIANPTGASPGQGTWVDIDYIVFTSGSSNDSSTDPVATSTPPWDAISSASASTSASVTSSAAPSSSKSDTVPVVLASVFGGIIGVMLLIFIIYFILSRMYETRHARERQFRYGQPSATPTTMASSRLNNFANRTPDWFSPFKRARPTHISSHSQSTLQHAAVSGAPAYSHTPIPSQSPGPVMSIDGSQQSNISSTVEKEGEGQRSDGRSTPAASRGFLTSSPMQFLRGKPDDANSMRTDFLQV